MAPMDTTIGALMVSAMCGFFFGGIVAVHAWRYWAMWPQDQILIKLCVGITLLCTFAVMLIWPSWSYLWGVTHWGDLTIFANVPYTFPAGMTIIGVGAVSVHIFYSWRLFVVARGTVWSWILPIWIVCNSIGQLLAMLITSASVIKNPSIADLPRIYTAAYIWMGCSMGADVGITFGLLYFLLWRTRRSAQYSQAHRTFKRIAVQAVENNVLSLFLQIFLALMMTRGPGFWWTIVDTTMLPTYAFSLLLSLNSRNPSNHGAYSSGGDSGPTYGSRGTFGNSKRNGQAQGGISVTIAEERHMDRSGTDSHLQDARQPWGQKGNPAPVAVVFDNSSEIEKMAHHKGEEHELGSL